MSFRLQLSWLVFSEMTSEGYASLSSTRSCFNLRGGRNFIRTIGGNIQTAYAPEVLEPTNRLIPAMQSIRRQLGIRENRFPFMISEINGFPLRTNIRLRLHDDALCAIVKVEPFADSDSVDLLKIEDLASHTILQQIVKHILHIATTGDSRSSAASVHYKAYPCIHISSNQQSTDGLERRLVAALTRHAKPNADVVTGVLQKNKAHQIDDSVLLLDKQGIVSYVSSEADSRQILDHERRLEAAAALLELAAALRTALNAKRPLDSDLIEMIRTPSEAIPDSVSAGRMWTLLVDEFKLQSRLNRVPVSHAPSASIRVLLVSATNVERMAIFAAMRSEVGHEPNHSIADNYIYSNLGCLGHIEVWHSGTQMGTGGLGGSQESVRRAIAAVKPTGVVMVGIAFGIDQTEQPIGTVLVARQLMLYEAQRIGPDSTVIRGDRPASSSFLLDWVAHASGLLPPGPAFEIGTVLSGEKLVDNKDFRDRLKSLAGSVIGGEMEGAGLYVACQNAKVDWILMKAVCDWADGDKKQDKSQRQQVAAQAAASFAIHVLKSVPGEDIAFEGEIAAPSARR